MKPEFIDQLRKIIPIIDKLSKLTYEIGTSFSGKMGSEIGLKGFVYLDLLQRINSNLEALIILLNRYETSPELKSPIALFLRTCLSDVLTGYYLYTFLKDEKSFENEVKILGLDYVSYMEVMIENEPRFSPEKLKEEELKTVIKDKKSFVASKYNDLIKSLDEDSGKFVKYSREELRADSDEELLKFEGKKSSINDKNKYDRLLRFPSLHDLGYVYVLMRFFSQYQHYGFYNRNVLLLNPFENFAFFVQSFFYITGAVYTFGSLIDGDEKVLTHVYALLDEYEGFRGLSNKDNIK